MKGNRRQLKRRIRKGLDEKMDSSVLAFIEQRIISNHAAADMQNAATDFSADLITSARNRTYIKTHLLMN